MSSPNMARQLPNGNILVGVDAAGNRVGKPGKSGWPSRSPDLNLMDEFIWGIMVSAMRFCDATTKAGLKRELQRVWREEITKEVCQRCIRHYFMLGGTLDRCIAADGKRFSRSALQG
jgi:hypothetical protein